MNPEQHANLCHSVRSLKAQFLESLDQGYLALQEDLQSWRQLVESRVHQKFAHIRDYEDIPSLVEGRRVRLREDSNLEMTGREYFDKYAKGGLGLLKMLDAAGYYTPPTSKFFLPFCKCLLEGSKILLRKDEVQPVYVPAEQVDLAFSKTQELIATDASLQKYCPAGIPIVRADKEFYLHVVNTIYRSIPYKVVLPLSEGEQKSAGQIRQIAADVSRSLIQAEPLAADVRSLGKLLEGSEGELITTDLMDLLTNEQARLVNLEQAEEMEAA